VPIDEGFSVTGIAQEKNYHIISAEDTAGNKKTYRTKAVIIGTGIHPRLLEIPGEEEFKGKGVTYCTVCDGPLFKNKTTATVGAGSSALESALMMAGIAKKVYLITKYPNTEDTKGGFPKGEDILIKKVKALDNIEVIYNANTTEISGEALVGGLTYTNPEGEKKELAVDGVMVHVGANPNSAFVDCVKKDKIGHIEIDILCRTSCTGIFAAGDITVVPYNQIAIATGHGVTAALSAIDYLNKWEEQ
jgi:alkyl hydroperoxide reductase subunit AhpF